MSDRPDDHGARTPGPARPGADGDPAGRRAERLKAALKANIARRKEQVRARMAVTGPSGRGAGPAGPGE